MKKNSDKSAPKLKNTKVPKHIKNIFKINIISKVLMEFKLNIDLIPQYLQQNVSGLRIVKELSVATGDITKMAVALNEMLQLIPLSYSSTSTIFFVFDRRPYGMDTPCVSVHVFECNEFC